MKHILSFNEFLNENLISKLKSAELEWTVDGSCGMFASTFSEIVPKSNVIGILDKKYKPNPTIQHYFIELGGKYFDGEGEKTLKNFEKKYGGVAVKINDEGYEFGKEESDYSDLPEWGLDTNIKQEIEKYI
jgi:hypothetical protein